MPVRSPAAIASATRSDWRTGAAIDRASQIAAKAPGRPTSSAETPAAAACHQSTLRLDAAEITTSTAPALRPSALRTGAATR